MQVNVNRSRELSQRYGAQIKECFTNSMILLRLEAGMKYVEGYCVIPALGFPIEHAWNVAVGLDGKEEVIDITLPLTTPPEELYGVKYETTATYTLEMFDALMARDNALWPPICLNHPPDGAGGDYRGVINREHHVYTFSRALAHNAGESAESIANRLLGMYRMVNDDSK